MIVRQGYFDNSSTDLQGVGGNEANTLSWEELASGPPHALTWFVVCKSEQRISLFLYISVVVDNFACSPRPALWIGLSSPEDGGERGGGAADTHPTRNTILTKQEGGDGDRYRDPGQNNTI